MRSRSALAALLFAAGPGFAQDINLPDDLVKRLTQAARDTLSSARLADGSTIPPETPEEKAQPIVPRPLELRTINRGLLSARLQVCSQDYRTISYLPFMNALQASGGYSPKQMAYLGILHGVTARMMSRPLDGYEPDCSEAAVAELKTRAATVQPATP